MKKSDLSALLFLLLSIPAFAQTQFLDNSFGDAGQRISTLPGSDIVQDLLVQPDGKILVAGTSYYSGKDRISLMRFHPDGTPDASFGLDGKTHTLLPDSLLGSLRTVALQSDGKIVVLGQNHSARYVLRYLPNGYPDDSGPFPIRFSTNVSLEAVAVDAQDRIILAGWESSGAPPWTQWSFVKRLNPDGTTDSTFAGDGSQKIVFSNTTYLSNVVLQPDGKIALAGRSTGLNINFVLARLHANGNPDNSFGTGGKVVLDIPLHQSASALALQPDGKFLVAGPEYSISPATIVRVNPDGSLDSTFASGGVLTLNNASRVLNLALAADGNFYLSCMVDQKPVILKFTAEGLPDSNFALAGILPASSENNLLAIQADQRLAVAGTLGGDFALARYLPDGAFDAGFNSGEPVAVNIGESGGSFLSIALQPDGKILAAGSDEDGYPIYGSLALARFDVKGSPDFGGHADGFFRRDGYVTGAVVLLQPDGKILAGGGALSSTTNILRFLPSGAPDSSFVYSGSWPVSALALQADAKILAGGAALYDCEGAPDTAYLARYLADGSLDAGFGTGGLVQWPTCCDLNVIALQADGKILAMHSDPCSELYRYLSDGTIDPSFENGFSWLSGSKVLALLPQPDGKILLALSDQNALVWIRLLENGDFDQDFGIESVLNNQDHATATVFLPDGKILVAGVRHGPDSADFFLARFLPNGKPDNTTGTSNYVVTDFNGGDDIPYALAVQPDGKVILAGSSDGKFALARYRADFTVEAKEVYGPRVLPLEIAPNPATDFLNLQLPKSATNTPAEVQVQVFDAQGRLVLSRALTPGQALHVHELPSGVYTLRVVAGKRAYAGRFVKE